MAGFHSHADGPVVHAAYRRAVATWGPDHPDTLNLRALVELRQKAPRRALQTCLAAIRANPTCGELWQCLGWIKHELGDHVASLAAYRRATLLDPGTFSHWPALIWASDISEYVTPEQRLAVRAEVDRRYCLPLMQAAPALTNDPDPDRQLRVGYVSADFFRHSAAFTFSLPLLGHDRDRFHVTCYSGLEYPPDSMTEKIKASADRWRVIGMADDEVLADQIRRDKIDILVDLSGVTSGGRLLAFARRPAPVQITGWGYACGVGLSYLDYLLSDRVLIPPEHQQHHAERILYLPALMAADIETAGDPLPDLVPRPDRPPTFGYFGRAMKTTTRKLSVWAQILERVPDARLILKMLDSPDRERQDAMVDVFVGLGVDARRIEFRGETSRYDHLAQHNDIDVALDSSPVGGGTTTLDATMMGVPTVTLMGETVSGRVAASILTATGEAGRIVNSPAEYVDAASELIGLSPLAAKQALRQRFLGSIMCDRARYTQALEDQYRNAWARWCATQREAVAV